ncbi:MAG: hypothetical protein FWG69_04495, partial [Oscillospiraceae bacterium]|nr:hypothetical protein [Oscillospiraceae bacterium]
DGRDYRIEFTNAFLDCSEQGGGLPLGLHPDHEGYIYAYGLKSYRGFLLYKFPVVARFKPEALEDISKWRFFDGTDWVEDMTKCAGIEDAEDGMVSSEYSVTYMEEGPFAGKYVMTFTEFTMSTQISIATSDTPWGPFSNKHDKKIVYYCPDIISIREANQDRDVYAYNAKAHPHLSAKDELLVSYNLNSMRFDDRVSFESIHPEFITIFTIKDHAETINPPEVFLPDPNTGSKTFILDYSPLIDVIDIINTAGIFTEEKYTLRSWISFQSELTAAKTLLKSSVATQAFIDTTAARLRQAMTALIERVIENANGWTKEDGKEFYFINNILQRNVWTDGEREVYRTDSDGAKITGTKWITVDRSQYYLMNGILQINKLIASGNKFYYVERNGARAEGTRWLTVDGKQYRLENGIIQTNKFIKVDRKLYYVDKNGIQASGTKWITVAGKQYRLINGAVQTGRFIKAGGRRYYLDKNGARAEGTKWISVNRKRYRIVRSVVQTNRFITVNKRRYYVDKTGIMRINTWIRHNKKWYRTNRKGVLITNRIVKINGKKYKFDKNGKSNR